MKYKKIHHSTDKIKLPAFGWMRDPSNDMTKIGWWVIVGEWMHIFQFKEDI